MSAELPPGVRLAVFDEIDSTNEEAKRRAEAGDCGPLWIIARRQSAGRGRRGRNWASLEGNLLTTLLVAPGRSAADSARLSFAAALSVHDLCTQLCPDAQIALKWPNDVLIADRKCAGILLESGAERDGVLPWLAVGIGVNLAHAPEGTPYPATALARHGAAASAELALGILARAWARWFALWQAQGFAPLHRAWLERAHGVGGPVVARLAETAHEGLFEGLDADGSLQLRRADGSLLAISSGEVFFGGC
jgi:BirA family biotin operon repressor/biotin-[acetyl-CoA-carboxylase] ligase